MSNCVEWADATCTAEIVQPGELTDPFGTTTDRPAIVLDSGGGVIAIEGTEIELRRLVERLQGMLDEAFPPPAIILMWVTEEEPTEPINPPYVPAAELGEPYVLAVCPHCGVVNNFAEVDTSLRWNPLGAIEWGEDGSLSAGASEDRDAYFESDGVICKSCTKLVGFDGELCW